MILEKIKKLMKFDKRDVIDKENGVMIGVKNDWICVNGKIRKDLDRLEDSEAHFSPYIFRDEWEGKYCDISEGELSTDKIFLYTCAADSFPLINDFNKFTYCKSPKFAAGYLLYIVIGMMIDFLGFTDILRKDCSYPDIDATEICSWYHLLDVPFERGDYKFDIAAKIKHIERLCYSVFYEQDVEKQKEYLTYAAEKFNEYFESAIEEQTGWCFVFKVYYGADAIKDVLPEYLLTYPPMAEVRGALEKPVWDDKDKELVQGAIDYII